MVRITHDFSNRGIRGQIFEQFITFEPNSRKTYELQELTTDCANELRPSQTEYDSATNPNICQSVSIIWIWGLCGIGVLGVIKKLRKRLPFHLTAQKKNWPEMLSLSAQNCFEIMAALIVFAFSVIV